jgi:hypothetical protein
MSNVLLGAVTEAAGSPTGGGVVYDPTSGGGVVTPTTPIPPVPPGGVVSLPKPEDITFPVPTETPTEQASGSSRKNLLLYGIGGLVLAYLLFRKK